METVRCVSVGRAAGRDGRRPGKPRSLDRQGHRVLADRSAAALAAADDTAVTIDQLLQKLDVLVIDEQRPGPYAIDPDRVLLLGLELGLGPLPRLGVFLSKARGEGHGRLERGVGG